MEITPAMFAHFVNLLSPLAEGKLCLIQEVVILVIYKLSFQIIFPAQERLLYMHRLAVLCLDRGIAGFPRFYRRCPLKRTQRGPKGAPRKSAYHFSLFSIISLFSVT